MILNKIYSTFGHHGIGRFCFVCGEEGVFVEQETKGEIFICAAAGHRSPRAFIFDGRAICSFENGELIHETAGALIRQGTGANQQTLLFLRRKYPYLYTIPAGHIEVGQDPELEMRREVAEETGLDVDSAFRLWPDDTLIFYDPCRRGADFHRWHVFEVTTTSGLARLSTEGRVIGWYNDDEIRDLAAENLLTAPVRTIMTKIGLLYQLT